MAKRCAHTRVVVEERSSHVVATEVELGRVVDNWESGPYPTNTGAVVCLRCGRRAAYGVARARLPIWVRTAVRAVEEHLTTDDSN